MAAFAPAVQPAMAASAPCWKGLSVVVAAFAAGAASASAPATAAIAAPARSRVVIGVLLSYDTSIVGPRPDRHDCPGGRSALVGERVLERAARLDRQLVEDLREVVLDGARADEQLRADVGVGEAVAREPGDPRLLRRQAAALAGRAPARRFAGRRQLAR